MCAIHGVIVGHVYVVGFGFDLISTKSMYCRFLCTSFIHRILSLLCATVLLHLFFSELMLSRICLFSRVDFLQEL